MILVSPAQVTVATSGTQQPLVAAAVSNVSEVYVSCPAANTGIIFLGDANVSTTRGIEIAKGTTVVIRGDQLDIANMFVDAATSGDKANVAYVKRAV